MLDYLISLDIKTLNIVMSSIDHDNAALISAITFLSDFGVIFVALTLIILWLFGTKNKDDKLKTASLYVFYSIVYSFILYILINKGFPLRPRPETVSTIRPLIDHLPDNSFPSGHAIFGGAALAGFYFFWRNKAHILMLSVITMLMLFSRVASGVHYPGDIIAGLILGLSFSFCFYRLQKIPKIDESIKDMNKKIIRLASYLKL